MTELDLVQKTQFLGKALLPESKAQEIVAPTYRISYQSVFLTSVPVHGFTQLGLRSHPIGPSTPETIKVTFS